MNRSYGGFLPVILAWCACALASPEPQVVYQTDTEISVRLDEYLTALSDAGRFDGAVLIARGDTVLLSEGFGLANFEFSIPVTPETVFPIGSNTKQFTAAGIMLLQNQGLLDIDDPVSMYIPDTPGHWNDIRIHHLLNHRSGIPSEGAYVTADPVDLALPGLISRIKELPLQFEPGEDMTYSNNGYITLSYIIEQVSGLSYDQFLKQNIFQPADMTSTGQHNARDVFPLRASGSTCYADRRIHYEVQNIHNRFGAGSLHSTTEDIFRWLRSFYTPGSILSPDASQAMIENDYGMVRAELHDRTVVGHGGRAVGFISYTLYFPDEDVTVIFLSNYDRTPMASLPSDLAAIVFGEPYSVPEEIHRVAVPATVETLSEYTGIYALEWESSWTFTVFVEGDMLFYTSSFPVETAELFYEGDDTFFVTPRSADSFIFTRDNDGNVNGLEMYTLEGMYDGAVKVSQES